MSDKPKMEAQAQGDCDICGEVDALVDAFKTYSVALRRHTECLKRLIYVTFGDGKVAK